MRILRRKPGHHRIGAGSPRRRNGPLIPGDRDKCVGHSFESAGQRFRLRLVRGSRGNFQANRNVIDQECTPEDETRSPSHRCGNRCGSTRQPRRQATGWRHDPYQYRDLAREVDSRRTVSDRTSDLHEVAPRRLTERLDVRPDTPSQWRTYRQGMGDRRKVSGGTGRAGTRQRAGYPWPRGEHAGPRRPRPQRRHWSRGMGRSAAEWHPVSHHPARRAGQMDDRLALRPGSPR